MFREFISIIYLFISPPIIVKNRIRYTISNIDTNKFKNDICIIQPSKYAVYRLFKKIHNNIIQFDVLIFEEVILSLRLILASDKCVSDKLRLQYIITHLEKLK